MTDFVPNLDGSVKLSCNRVIGKVSQICQHEATASGTKTLVATVVIHVENLMFLSRPSEIPFSSGTKSGFVSGEA